MNSKCLTWGCPRLAIGLSSYCGKHEEPQSPLATNVRENGVSINNGQGETADSLRERVRELEGALREIEVLSEQFADEGTVELAVRLIGIRCLATGHKLTASAKRLLEKSRAARALSAKPTKDQTAENPQGRGGGE
jgi:hypothetical protein